MNKKIIIIGGVAGGATTAARLRRLDETANIIIFEKGEYISFANCGLPYYIGGSITQRDSLLVQTVKGMSNRFNLDIRNLSEVVSINKESKTITVNNLQTRETYTESYDYLVLSPGASPIKPTIPGIEHCDNLFTLRNIPDTDAIKSYIDTNKPSNAVIIGGGFIGIEMAENLYDKGINITIVEMGDQIMTPIDFEMASILHNHIRDKGVNLILNDGVKEFKDNGKTLVLSSNTEIPTDMIILSIGVKPENKLAVDANLEIGQRGGICVNDYLQTSDPYIYAIGDAIEVTDFVSKKPTLIPLAWPANRQGRIVADNLIYNNKTKYSGALGTSIAKVFDLTVSSTGNNEKILKKLNINYKSIHIHPSSHASYYPGAHPISLKLIFNPINGNILGAQAIGSDGVDKRIDVLATAIKCNLTVFDIQDLELSYAPPYSSAKDPVNMAGYVASNIVEKLADTVQWNEIDDIISSGGILIDVRTPAEVDMGSIQGSINIPLDKIRTNLHSIPKDKDIYVSCQVGLRGYLASRILIQNGYKVKNLDGGYKTYSSVFKYKTSPNIIHPIQKKEDISPLEYIIPVSVIDTCGLQCPGPIMKVYQTMQTMKTKEILEVKATDIGFTKDIDAWCDKTGNTLLNTVSDNDFFRCYIEKGTNNSQQNESSNNDNATLVVFSGDLDKAIASFIIATGAATMGKDVTMFFTFWGLNILRKQDPPSVRKDFIEKIFGFMMPKGTSSLPISKMNMGGMGAKMIKHVMHKKNVDSLDTLIKNALDLGVKLVACSMSMDVMGLKKEEFIDRVDIGGVASYLGDAEKSKLNLFI